MFNLNVNILVLIKLMIFRIFLSILIIMSIKTKSIFKVNNKFYLLCTTEINKSILDSIQSKWFNVITVISFFYSSFINMFILCYAMQFETCEDKHCDAKNVSFTFIYIFVLAVFRRVKKNNGKQCMNKMLILIEQSELFGNKLLKCTFLHCMHTKQYIKKTN